MSEPQNEAEEIWNLGGLLPDGYETKCVVCEQRFGLHRGNKPYFSCPNPSGTRFVSPVQHSDLELEDDGTVEVDGVVIQF